MLYLVIHAGMKVSIHVLHKQNKKKPKKPKITNHNPRYRDMYILFTMIAVFKAFVKHRRNQLIVYILVSF